MKTTYLLFFVAVLLLLSKLINAAQLTSHPDLLASSVFFILTHSQLPTPFIISKKTEEARLSSFTQMVATPPLMAAMESGKREDVVAALEIDGKEQKQEVVAAVEINGKEEEEEGVPAVEMGRREQEVEEDKVVRVVKKGKVLPTKLDPEKRECPLVTFDLPYITFYYNQKLLVYRVEDEGGFGEKVEKLKEGLAAALEYFYPLAGKLGLDEEGVLRVECAGDSVLGVEVVEAEALGVAVSDLADGDAPEFLQEIVPCSGVMNLEGLHSPLMAVQFTKLKDGLAIGCGFNHAILDGQSTWHFMGAWAELCRGAATVSLLPFHDRTKARNTRVKLELPKSAADHEKADPSKAFPQKVLREKIFNFSEKAIDKIKSEVNAGLPEGSKPLSTFQSLGAHVWRAVCRARHLKPDDYTVFAIFTDCRRRLDPPMPESYFGNLIQAIFTVTASGLLLASPPQFGAGLLQKVIDSHDAEAIDIRSKEWEVAPKLFHYKDAGVNCVAVGSSPRFRVYDVDFGFGTPEKVRSGNNNKFDGMMYLYQSRDGGRSIDVELTLDVDALAELGKDDDFLMSALA